jgi:integrase
MIPEFPKRTRLYDYLQPDESKQIATALDDNNNKLTYRSKAIGKLAYYTGMRRIDIANLRFESINLEKEEITFVQQKTGLEVCIPLRSVVGNAIYDYIVNERPKCASDNIFISATAPFIKLSPAGVSHDCERIFKETNIHQEKGRSKGSHLFRHAFASGLIARDTSLSYCERTVKLFRIRNNLTALQKEANQKHGFSADKTLSIAQKLYENKLMSYPRTGSRYISADVFDEIPELINTLKTHPRFGGYTQSMDNSILNIRCVDDKKVTDHHALLITENKPKELSADEQTIYEMVAGRMLEAFSKKCVKDATTIICVCGDTLFEAKGAVIKQAGWRAVFNEKEETDEDGALPEVTQGETLPILKSELLEKQTKPKPLHTEASLLSEMETAGKMVENEAERAAMKESGIGTPATRATIIETLFSRNYIIREKKSLVPTEKGLTVYETVKDKRIADVALTGSWENTLAQIESGEMQLETFKKTIEIYTGQITAELLGAKIEVSDSNACICPKCKTAPIRFYPKVAKCSDQNCGLVVFRTISEKELTDRQVLELLTKGKTAVIKGFKSKAGKTFDAALKIDENYKTVFEFPEKNKGNFKKKS